MMVKSRHQDIDLVYNESLSQYVLRHARRHLGRIAMIEGSTGTKWTYDEFIRCVKNLSAAFFHQGMRKGHRVCIFAPNIPEYPIILHSILSTGATVVTANPAFVVNELVYELDDSQAGYLVTIPELIETVKAATKKNKSVHTVYVVGQVPGFQSYQDLLVEGSTHAFPDHVQFNTKEDVALIAYSSGTTGFPKGVMITHFSLLALVCLLSSSQVGMYRSYDTTVAFLPFYHLYGLVTLLNDNFVVGDTMVVMRKFHLQSYLQLIQKYKASLLLTVPPVAVLMSKSEVVRQYDLTSVRSIVSSAAPLSAEVIQLLLQRLPQVQDIKQVFGLTEMISMVGIRTEPVGSCGRLLPNVEAKVIEPGTGRELGVGEEGELLLRGPQMMKGYLNRPQATAETIDKEGWLHTGDLAKYDKEGNFFIVDRLKELIKFKGFQVAPAELEALLLTHPGIADTAVVGQPDAFAGELPTAFVVRKLGITLDEADVIRFVEGNVSDYKRLRGGVVFLTEIPKTPSGKILRRYLRNQLSKSKSKL